jgi:hypothetical protein
MSVRDKLMITATAAALSGLMVPGFAETQRAQRMQDPGSNTDQGMMVHGMMSRGMMSGGCAGMMQSMNNGGAPNSQWRSHGQNDQSMPN